MNAAIATICAAGLTIAFIVLLVALVVAVRASGKADVFEPIELGDFAE